MTNLSEPQGGDARQLEPDEPYPGVRRRSFSTSLATVTLYDFGSRAVFPRHRHPQEQITLVQSGEVRFTVGDTVHQMHAGSWVVVAPEVEHGLEAGEEGAEVVAVIIPPRRAFDAYILADAGSESDV